MHQQGYRIVLCSGRYEKHRQVTNQWLERNGVPYHEIRLRRNDDKRPDIEVKREMVCPNELQEVLFVVEDRSRNVQMWRALGLVCLQCDGGEF